MSCTTFHCYSENFYRIHRISCPFGYIWFQSNLFTSRQIHVHIRSRWWTAEIIFLSHNDFMFSEIRVRKIQTKPRLMAWSKMFDRDLPIMHVHFDLANRSVSPSWYCELFYPFMKIMLESTITLLIEQTNFSSHSYTYQKWNSFLFLRVR